MEQSTTSVERKSGVQPPHSKLRVAVGLFALWLLVAGVLTFSRLTHEAFGVQGDLTLHYHITRSYAQSFSEGDPLPRWAGLLDGGRGDALFTFYPPLCYFTSALLMKLFGLDVLNSIKALTFLILLLAQASAYLLAREFFSRRLSLLVSLTFVLLPALPLIGLHRAFLANAFALSFMPLALKHAYRLIEPGRHHARHSIIAFALSFSAIILSHAITTYLTGLTIGFLALAYLPRAGWQGLLQLTKAGLLALSLTAFFLLPQIAEANWVQLKLQLTQQDYRNYFLFAKAATTERYRQAWAGVNDFASYMTITQTLAAALLALLCWPVWWRDRLSPLVWFGVMLAGFGFLIALPASDLLWRYLPGLKFIQFPWRFQPFVALGCATLAAAAIQNWRQINKRLRMLTMAGLTWLLLGSAIFTFMIARLEEHEVTRAQVITGLTAFEEPPLTIAESKTLQNEDDMKYLPYSANQLYFRPVGADFKLYAPAKLPGEATIVKGAGQITTVSLEIARRRFQVESAQPTQVRINTYNHPNWHALLDGANVSIQSEPETGLMLIDVPGGQHRITLTFDPRHSTARTARLVSITAWALLALTLGFSLIRRR
ncbi:MAG: 6-pyruvoyl-tetrahydropterin synthase-related protein [Blastocatellia bacterium]